MNNPSALSLAAKLTIIGLLIAAAGISTLFLTNSVNVPAIPVGPILLLLTAGLVALGPWRWTPVVGIALSVALLVGAFIAPGLFDRLSNPAQLGGFAGTAIQMLGIMIAIVAGTFATVQNYQPRTSATNT
ncbi:MAG TPA: hypothetical protein VFM49_28470 [Chloroflexia bacterium]|jgi:hypothetical protein|nr:hypothetical protein [Chloroflexia bacterium]